MSNLTEAEEGTLHQLSINRKWRIIGILAVTGITGLTAAIFLPAPMASAVALLVFCTSMWVTAVVPEYWPALAFFLFAMIFEIAPAQTVFSGFHSSTFWLMFSGAVMGAAIGYTGLGQRAAALLSGVLGTRYSSAITGIVLFSVALAFIMPSGMGRVVLLIPITMAVAEHMGYGPGDNGRIGMLMAAAFSSFLPTFSILTSNVPNMILSGMAENLYGLHISYGRYLLVHFPVLGAIKSGLLILLILRMFPDRDPVHRASSDEYRISPMSSEERRLTAVLGLCLALWLTDGIHHLSPAWIGLAAALYCLWPNTNLTSKKCLNEEISYGTLFFVAGVMGLGAVISATGLGEAVVEGLSRHANFSVARPLWNVTALTLISTLVAIVTNLASVPATMTPMAQDLANITGLPLETVLMTQVLGFSNVFLPYLAPPLIFAIQIANLPAGAVTRLCLALFIISALVLTPLDFLWWHILGLL